MNQNSELKGANMLRKLQSQFFLLISLLCKTTDHSSSLNSDWFLDCAHVCRHSLKSSRHKINKGTFSLSLFFFCFQVNFLKLWFMSLYL